MPKNCCVKNCKNFWFPNCNLSFHSFPWKNQQCLDEWLNIVPTNNKITKNTQVCSVHFDDSDYTNTQFNRTLKKNVVPRYFPDDESSLQIASICDHDSVDNLPSVSPDVLPEHNLCNDSPSSTSVESPTVGQTTNTQSSNFHPESLSLSPSTNSPIGNDKSIQSIIKAKNDEIAALKEKDVACRRKIKTLQARLRRYELKLNTMSSLLQVLKRKGTCTETLEKELSKFPDDVLELFHNLKNNSNKKKGAYRYTDKMKEFAKIIYFYSPQAYRFLREKLLLPEESTLRKQINKEAEEMIFEIIE